MSKYGYFSPLEVSVPPRMQLKDSKVNYILPTRGMQITQKPNEPDQSKPTRRVWVGFRFLELYWVGLILVMNFEFFFHPYKP